MADQIKERQEAKNILATIFKVIVGLGFLVLGIWATIAFWPELFIIAKGSLGPFLIVAGIIILAIAKE